MLTFDDLREVNISRCARWHGEWPVTKWNLSDFGVEFAGEAGEVCDVLKKKARIREDMPGNKKEPDEIHQDLVEEIGDALITLDLLAAHAGITLEEAAKFAFNQVSERVGFPERL